jgi:CheY-like chemotaxis protein
VSPDLDRHPLLDPDNEDRRTPAPRGGGLHILVAEDDPATAATLALVLRRDGHRVQLAPDGPTAVERARDQPPDVVLLDIGLPGLDGLEVVRRLPPPQALAKRPFLIAVSGPGLGAAPRWCREAGIDLLLARPLDLGLLRWVLRRFQQLLLPGGAPPDEPR